MKHRFQTLPIIFLSFSLLACSDFKDPYANVDKAMTEDSPSETREKTTVKEADKVEKLEESTGRQSTRSKNFQEEVSKDKKEQ